MEEFLAGIGHYLLFVETHAIEEGAPWARPLAMRLYCLYGAINRRYVGSPCPRVQGAGHNVCRLLLVGNNKGITDPPVAVIGRNNRTGQQVWSADWGYPGDADYREFHKKDHESGLQYWRVTGPRVDLASKDHLRIPIGQPTGCLITPATSPGLSRQLVAEYHAQSGRYGLILQLRYRTLWALVV